MTDTQALLQVKTRLINDVGGLIELIDSHPTLTPFWALIRALFPIAEAVSDLAYYRQSQGSLHTQEMLIKLFRERFGTINKGYAQFAGVLVVIYRHSLTHQDELRTLLYEDAGIAMTWAVSFHASGKHMQVEMVGGTYKDMVTGKEGQTAHLFFDVRQFYLDLIQVIDSLLAENLKGDAGKRYEEWLTYRMGKTVSDKEARKDIDAMLKVTTLLPIA